MSANWAKTKKEEQGKKVLVLYIPLTWSTVHSRVFKSIMDMIHPEILELLDSEFGVVISPLIHDPFPIDFNRNDAVVRAIEDHGADYVMFCDADQVFPRNTLVELLKLVSDEFPVVTGIYFRKKPPHTCVIGKYLPNDQVAEARKAPLAGQGLLTDSGDQCLYYRDLQSFDVVQPVDAFGMGCVLVRTDVFSKLEQPYFKYINGYTTGDYTFQNITEDMWFCAQLKKKGIRTLCNPKVLCGHMVEKVIVGNEFAS